MIEATYRGTEHILALAGLLSEGRKNSLT